MKCLISFETEMILSIGQMIEFLETPNIAWGYKPRKWTVGIVERMIIVSEEELCDALWEAVKEILER